MKPIDEQRLEDDIVYRFQYLTEFMEFGPEDVAAIRQAIGELAPRIPAIVEATYEKLLAYDATARHFVPRQHGYDGPVPESLTELRQNHEQIQFRKEHLQRYLMNLLGNGFNEKTASYFDMVGKMHTPKAGSDEIDVPLVQMNALMGVVSDALTAVISRLEMEEAQKWALVRAWQKLLWIQNDFINRHYAEVPANTPVAS